MTETAGKQLLGTKEAAALYGVNVPNFIRDWASRPDFPAPAETLSTGRIWRRADLEVYKAAAGPKRGARTRQLPLSPAARQWLPVVKRRIVRGFRPERIILFGSQARGEANEYSDIDLLVVVPPTADVTATASAIRRSAAGFPIDFDVLVTTPDELARNLRLIGSIVRPAMREGITVYARA